MMKLIYIEPSVLILGDEQNYLFYDTLSYQSLFLSKQGIEMIIGRIIQNEERHYYTEVTEEELQQEPVQAMVNRLRKHFMGDLVAGDYRVLPAIFNPIAVFQQSKLREDGIGRTLSSEGFNNLREVTLFNDCVCTGHCNICNLAFRQTCCCHREEEGEIMSLDLIRKVLAELRHSSVYAIRFVGAKLAGRKELGDLLKQEFETMKDKFVFYFTLEQWAGLTEAERERWLSVGKVAINVFEDIGGIQEIRTKLALCVGKNADITVRFLVTSREEYEWAADLAGEYTSEIVPVYTGHNTDFFESEVFMNAEDILADQHTMKMIHGRQYLNYHYFGKILIKPNGEMAGIWDQPVGNVNQEEIAYLAEKLLLHDSVWLKVRKEEPCSECLYRWLCPSPSDYEQVMGRPNLCHVK